MSQSPPISVVIPVKDGERFIETCLSSVLEQQGADFEIVVVDDASTDGTSRLVESFETARMIPGPGRGPGPARNAGVRASSGELVAFLDADDMMLPGRLAGQRDFLAAHPAVGAVFGRQELLVEQGEAPQWVRPDRALHQPGGLHVMSGMFRRGSFEQVGGFDESYFMSEDLDLLFRMRQAGIEMAFEDDVVVRRRIHGDNLTFNAPGIRGELLRSVGARIAEHRRV